MSAYEPQPDGTLREVDDLVQVVRCKDCERTAPYGGGIECLGPLVQTWDYYNDEPLHNPVQPDGFCAWARRRESE